MKTVWTIEVVEGKKHRAIAIASTFRAAIRYMKMNIAMSVVEVKWEGPVTEIGRPWYMIGHFTSPTGEKRDGRYEFTEFVLQTEETS